MNTIKIAYFGTGVFSAEILKGILKDPFFEIKLVVSQADKKIGREQILTPTAVKKLALENNLEVLQPEKLKTSPLTPLLIGEGNSYGFLVDKLKSLNLDFIIVVAYGKIIPKEILEMPANFVVNIHGSILPIYRGASPIQESIKKGDTRTGLTIMKMSEGMDEGDILSIKEIDIDLGDKTQDIFNKFGEIGEKLLSTTLQKYLNGEIQSIKQEDSKATYCSKISKEDGKIDFVKMTAKQIYDTWRAYSTWPGIYTYFKGKKLDITDCFFDEHEVFLDDDFKIGDVVELEDPGEKSIGIICKSGILILNKIKLEGKKEMDIFSFVNGYKDFLDYNFM